MKKPIGIMKANGDMILTEYGIEFIVSCIRKGEVIDTKTLIKRKDGEQ